MDIIIYGMFTYLGLVAIMTIGIILHDKYKNKILKEDEKNNPV